jgi:hypothetical protein
LEETNSRVKDNAQGDSAANWQAASIFAAFGADVRGAAHRVLGLKEHNALAEKTDWDLSVDIQKCEHHIWAYHLLRPHADRPIVVLLSASLPEELRVGADIVSLLCTGSQKLREVAPKIFNDEIVHLPAKFWMVPSDMPKRKEGSEAKRRRTSSSAAVGSGGVDQNDDNAFDEQGSDTDGALFDFIDNIDVILEREEDRDELAGDLEQIAQDLFFANTLMDPQTHAIQAGRTRT